MQPAASEPDRYAGIYQTVNVVKGSSYQFKASGLVREALKDGLKPNPDDDTFRYRVQWGYTADGATDWTKVTNWVEFPWDKIDSRTSPSGLQSFATTLCRAQRSYHPLYSPVEKVGDRSTARWTSTSTRSACGGRPSRCRPARWW